MKKGILFKLIVFAICIAVLITAFLLVFSVKEFELNCEKSYGAVKEADLNNYLEKYKKTNIVSLSEEELALDLEHAFPYVDVLDVERVFTSKIIVKYAERVSLYAVNYDSKYNLFDIDGYLVEITDANQGAVGNYPCIEISGIELPQGISFVLGEKTDFGAANDKIAVVQEMFETYTLLETSYNEFEIKSFMKSVAISKENDLYIEARIGTRLTIYEADNMLSDKIRLIMGAYTSGMASEIDRELIVGNDLIVKLA